jgi:hypothetical protein
MASEDCKNTMAQTVAINFQTAMIFANQSSEIHFLRDYFSCEFCYNFCLPVNLSMCESTEEENLPLCSHGKN